MKGLVGKEKESMNRRFIARRETLIKKIEPKLQDVINYLKSHPNLLRYEKNPYTAERLMMLLDNEKLAALEDEFNEHPNGIELANFIWLMKCAIVHPVEEKYELVTGLIKLFQDIDINGDKRMEWSEFTQYIIDAVIGEKDARFFDARFEKERELTETEIIDKAYSRKTKRYVQSKFFDNSTHSNLIKKIVYSTHNEILFSLEQSSNTLKFYSSDCQEKILNKKKVGLTVPADYNKVSFIIDFALAESLNTIAVVTSKKQIIFWEANFSQKLIKSQKMDVLQTGVWYLSLHKIWVTAGDDFNLKTWIFTPSMSTGDNKRFKLSHDKMLKAHTKKIMDVVELTAPRIVASASLDGKIKLWDLADSEPRLLTILTDPQNCDRGVRQLTYSHSYGSNLLSVGFEQHINIWCPEISITRAFIGRLEGHSSLVVLCRFIPLSPNVISIDDKCNIRIWDIRGMATIQVIQTDGGYSLVTDVCFVTGKYDRFILAGKRLTYFENAEVHKTMKNANDEIYPLNVDFNLYFNQLVVLTKIDMRLYDAMTGKLKKVFNEIHDDKYSVELSMFCFGARQRKFFLCDNGGMIRQYNMKNGEFLKKVNDPKEIEDSEFSKKQSHIRQKETNEVSALIYINEEKLLIASYSDATIRIYDESEAEESILLKVLSGAHRDSEIISLTYSPKQQLLASGSANGIVALWDFETGKLEGVLKADDYEVTQIEFLDPYPAIATSTSNGFVYIWGSRHAPSRFKYRAIIKIVNTMWVDGVETIIPVHSMLSENTIVDGFLRQTPADGYQPPEVLSFNPIFTKTQAADKTTAVFKTKKPMDKFSNNVNFTDDSQVTHSHHHTTGGGHHQKEDILLSPHRNPKEFDDFLSSPRNAHFEEIKAETNEGFQSYWNMYEHNRKTNKTPYSYLYVGDAKGFVQVWNLTDIFATREIQPMKEEKKKQIIQLRRKDLINATKAAENMLSGLERRNNLNLLVVHAVNSVLLKRWQGHTSIVNKLTRMQEPPTVFSCSHDKTIKIWSLNGDFLSKINLVAYDKQNNWNFPYNWVNQKMTDLDMVFDSLKVIENEQLQGEQKEKVRMRYLTSKYFQETEHTDLQREMLEAELPEFNEKEKNNKQQGDGEAEFGIKIKYDSKPQPSLQDEFNAILHRFQQEKEEEENRLKRLDLSEKESNQVDLKQIRKFYNIDKYTKEISLRKVYDLNTNFNNLYYPNDEDNIIVAPALQTFLTSKDSPTKSVAPDKKNKFYSQMSHSRLKPSTTKAFATNNMTQSSLNANVPMTNSISVPGLDMRTSSRQQPFPKFNTPQNQNQFAQTSTVFPSIGALPTTKKVVSMVEQSNVINSNINNANNNTDALKLRKSSMSSTSSTSSQMKRKIFSLSTNNFLRNNAFVSSITKHLLPKKTDEEDKFKPQIDMKYKLGESHRCYRVAQQHYSNAVASDSPQILFADNDLLQQKMRNLRSLHAKKRLDQDDDDEEFRDIEDSDGDNETNDPTMRNSRINMKTPNANFEKRPSQHDESNLAQSSVGFSSFISKQKSSKQ